MVDENLLATINDLSKGTLGHKLSGAGGGGYLILVSDCPIANSIQIKIRRKNLL